MDALRWIVIAALACAGCVLLGFLLLAEPPRSVPSAPAAANRTYAPRAETVVTALEDPDALEPQSAPLPDPNSTGASEDALTATTREHDRSLAATLEWLKRVQPERFGALTVEQALTLEVLELRGVSLTDEDLPRLAAFPNLRSLGLRGTAITDEGLAALRALPLASLDLRGTKITGSGIASLPTNTLTALHLTDTQVTEATLARMPNLPALATLKLNRLRVGDAAIESLSIYGGLKHLEMDGTGLTDAGLMRLLELHPGLTRIEARQTSLSPQAIAAARTTHPGCEIVTQ